MYYRILCLNVIPLAHVVDISIALHEVAIEKSQRPEQLLVKVLRSAIVPGRAAEPGTLLDDALTIACGEGTALRLVDVQRAGKGVMPAAEFLKGADLKAGRRL